MPAIALSRAVGSKIRGNDRGEIILLRMEKSE